MKESPLQLFFKQKALASTLSSEEQAKLETYENLVKEPIFIKILVGAGAWFSSIFAMVFIASSGIVGDEVGALTLGFFGLLLGVATRKTESTFSKQMSLVMVATGHILIMFAAANIYNKDEITVCLIIHASLTLLLYPWYTSTIYRFLAPFTVGLFGFFWIQEEGFPLFFHLLVLLQTGCIGLLFVKTKYAASLRPLAYSGLFLLPGLFMLNHTGHFADFHRYQVIGSWPSTLFITMGLFSLVLYYSHDWRGNKTVRVAILLTIMLSLFATPAILTAMGLFIIGHGMQKRVITVLAYIYMPLSLTSYYYFMGVDLAHKSWIMMASGLLLLACRFLLGKMQPPQEAKQ